MAQQLSFARDIRPLFRDRDIQSMQSAFDLASYRKDFDRMSDSGEMPSFWEGEIWRDHAFAGIATVPITKIRVSPVAQYCIGNEPDVTLRNQQP